MFEPLSSFPPRMGEEPSESLNLIKDPHGFMDLALLRLDLLFEKNPAKRKKLLSTEQLMEEVEGLDWPISPTGGVFRAHPHPLDLDAVFTASVELAPGDIPFRDKTHGGSPVRRTGSRPLPFLSPKSDPRATGAGSLRSAWGPTKGS